MNENVIIPFYLNEVLMNNLYSIIVQKFANIKRVSMRKQSIVNVTTPLSNVLEGQYVQGDLSVQILNEFQRERAEEKVSIIIEVFMNTLDALNKQGLLKTINSKQDMDNIKKDDFIQFSTKLNKFPVLRYVEDMLSQMEMEEIFNFNKVDSSGESQLRGQMIGSIKSYINEHEKRRCVKYLSDDIYNSNKIAILPLKMEYMQGDIDYLMNSKVWIFSKVINVCNNSKDKCEVLQSGTCFDYMDTRIFNLIEKNLFREGTSTMQKYNQQFAIEKYQLIETIPIAIYI